MVVSCSSKQFFYMEAQVQLEAHKSNPLKNLLSGCKLFYMSSYASRKNIYAMSLAAKISFGIISIVRLDATHWLVQSATLINIVASLQVKCLKDLLVSFSTQQFNALYGLVMKSQLFCLITP